MGNPQNANTLGGLLNSLQVPISPAQLRALPNQPIPLIGSPGPGVANLIVRVIASLKFGTTPYTAGPGTRAQMLYGGPSRLGVDAALLAIPVGPFPFLSFPGTAVANASGGNTSYAANLSNVGTNALVGFPVVASGYSHAANNGNFTIVSNSQSAIVLNNAAGVLEAAPPEPANLQLFSSLALAGGSGQVDLTTLLTSALADTVQTFEVASPAFPSVEVANVPIYLGTSASVLSAPQNFSAGDSSVTLTILYSQLQL
jgi:hypothetical protein